MYKHIYLHIYIYIIDKYSLIYFFFFFRKVQKKSVAHLF